MSQESDRQRHLRRLCTLATVMKPAIIAPVIARDLADDLVLATALSAQANAIVSGDRHLLELKVYRHIPIVIAAEACIKATHHSGAGQSK